MSALVSVTSASEITPGILDTIQDDIEMEEAPLSDADPHQLPVDFLAWRCRLFTSPPESRRRPCKESSSTSRTTALISEWQNPLTPQETMSRPDAEQWCQAINAELDTLPRNDSVLAGNARPAQTKLVFCRKALAHGLLDKHKAILPRISRTSLEWTTRRLRSLGLVVTRF